MCVEICAHMCKCLCRPEEGIGSLRAKGTSGHGMPSVGAGNQTPVLQKQNVFLASGEYFWELSHSGTMIEMTSHWSQLPMTIKVYHKAVFSLFLSSENVLYTGARVTQDVWAQVTQSPGKFRTWSRVKSTKDVNAGMIFEVCEAHSGVCWKCTLTPGESHTQFISTESNCVRHMRESPPAPLE